MDRAFGGKGEGMRRMSLPSLALIVLFVPAGCVIGESSLGETTPMEAGSSGDAEGSSESSTGGPGMTSMGMTSMGTTADPEPTTGGPEMTGGPETTTTTGGTGVQHPACAQPAPSPLPGLPTINETPGGDPAFTVWETIPCDDPAVVSIDLCTPSCPGGSDVCLHGGTNEGVCTSFDVDIWCDGEGEVAGYGNGCFMCMPVEAHARGCCEFPGTFDCRVWPYEGTSGVSMVCATHDDCEEGLVCASPHGSDDTGYGLCRCPEDVGQDNDLGRECY